MSNISYCINKLKMILDYILGRKGLKDKIHLLKKEISELDKKLYFSTVRINKNAETIDGLLKENEALEEKLDNIKNIFKYTSV